MHKEAVYKLNELFKSRFIDDADHLKKLDKAMFYHASPLPEAVCYPETTQEVQKLMQICNAYAIPIVAYGAGTSVEGQTHAIHGGLLVNFSRMNKIVELAKEDMYVRVQPGIAWDELNRQIADTDLFFPVDPFYGATIGGMVNTRASGTNAYRYGTMKHNVMGLQAIIPNGECLDVGTKAIKSSAGYDLTSLFIGSEGTLGLITEVTLRLHPKPRYTMVAVCQFTELQQAVDTVVKLLKENLQFTRVELADSLQMDACIKYTGITGFDSSNTLFFELEGNDSDYLEKQLDVIKTISAENLRTTLEIATEKTRCEELWRARKMAGKAALALEPAKSGMVTDVCVPRTKLAECIKECKKWVTFSGLIAPLVGHVGDGNFHFTILVNKNDPQEIEKAKSLNAHIVKSALKMGGTISGEHGIGLGKKDFMLLEHSAATLDIMRRLKKAFDPQNILNPGKVINPPLEVSNKKVKLNLSLYDEEKAGIVFT